MLLFSQHEPLAFLYPQGSSLVARCLLIPSTHLSSPFLSFVCAGRPPSLPLDCAVVSFPSVAGCFAPLLPGPSICAVKICAAVHKTHRIRNVAVVDHRGSERLHNSDRGHIHYHIGGHNGFRRCDYYHILVANDHNCRCHNTLDSGRSGTFALYPKTIRHDSGAEQMIQTGFVFEPHTVTNASVGDIIGTQEPLPCPFTLAPRKSGGLKTNLDTHRVQILPVWPLGRAVRVQATMHSV